MKINRAKLRQLIMKELSNLGEETLLKKDNYLGYGILNKHNDAGRQAMMSTCSECGSNMVYEGECSECGNMVYEKKKLNECGCGGCAGCSQQAEVDINDIVDMFDNKNIQVDIDLEDEDHDEHYSGAYMAKSQLYKVSKYAEKLYQMIPDGYNLEDWMRTKLAEIADDISDVYHALDHDKFSGDF